MSTARTIKIIEPTDSFSRAQHLLSVILLESNSSIELHTYDAILRNIVANTEMTVAEKIDLLKMRPHEMAYNDDKSMGTFCVTPRNLDIIGMRCSGDVYVNALRKLQIAGGNKDAILELLHLENKHQKTLVHDMFVLYAINDYIKILVTLYDQGVPHQELMTLLTKKDKWDKTALDNFINTCDAESLYLLAKYNLLRENDLNKYKVHYAKLSGYNLTISCDSAAKNYSLISYILFLPAEEKTSALNEALKPTTSLGKIFVEAKNIREIFQQELKKQPEQKATSTFIQTSQNWNAFFKLQQFIIENYERVENKM